MDDINVLMKLHLAGERIPHMEDRIFKDPKTIRTYINHLCEAANISANGNYSHRLALYAMNSMKERWPIAEKFIMKTSWAPYYAKGLITGRWRAAEPYILKLGGFTLAEYLSNFDGRYDEWHEGYLQLKKSPPSVTLSYLNRLGAAHNSISRMFDLEDRIILNSECSVQYAMSHRRFFGRWFAGEYSILHSTGIGRYVATHKIRLDDWPEAYRIIMSAPEKIYDFLSYLGTTKVEDLCPEIHKDMILKLSENAPYAYLYAHRIAYSRFYEAETVILNSTWADMYTQNVIRGRWQEYEDTINTTRKLKNYLKNMKRLSFTELAVSKIRLQIIKRNQL